MEAHKPGFFKSLLTTIGTLVVVAAIVLFVQEVLKLPVWPAIFFSLAFFVMSPGTKTGWVDSFGGLGIGILTGLSNIIVGHFFGNTVGFIVLLVAVILLMTATTMKYRFGNLQFLVGLTTTAMFSHGFTYEMVGGILLSFLFGAALCGAVVLVIDAMSKKKVVAQTATAK